MVFLLLGSWQSLGRRLELNKASKLLVGCLCNKDWKEAIVKSNEDKSFQERRSKPMPSRASRSNKLIGDRRQCAEDSLLHFETLDDKFVW
ncbi:hypothetical protein GOP47_0007719 [Adiantum capillus-veneris]|uniref:Uncharacterized protein n=1 Tax=Adiantum capillus-veneris TaxID=13818 RepID=A0A9D4V189_ADICA|nr:hypothetical protein GOP47_0007719 [Adiantum capillus-veneris]